MDRRQVKGGEWGQFQGDVRPTGQDEKATETPGLRVRDCRQHRQNWENQTGTGVRELWRLLSKAWNVFCTIYHAGDFDCRISGISKKIMFLYFFNPMTSRNVTMVDALVSTMHINKLYHFICIMCKCCSSSSFLTSW